MLVLAEINSTPRRVRNYALVAPTSQNLESVEGGGGLDGIEFVASLP